MDRNAKTDAMSFNDGLNWAPHGNPDMVMDPDHENGNDYIARVGGVLLNYTGGCSGCSDSSGSCYSGVFFSY
tara:strand:+ start:810 stop:1025 length:216 start_codon:yes stop_codon:yes gene_type:complete